MGKGVIKTIKGTGGSPLDNLKEGEYGIYITHEKEVSFMDLMKSDITREMKKTQYEMYCDANEIDLGIREAKYEELIKLMYRSSEFSYMTGTEKIVNYVDTAAVVVILAALVGPAGTIPLSVVRVTGWYLSGKNVVLWLMGVDVNGDKLTAKQREELLGRIAEDAILALTIWGLGKIYRRSLAHIDLDVVDDVDDALKNVSGVDDIIKQTGLSENQVKKLLENTGLSADELAEMLKNGTLDDVLRNLNPNTRLPRNNGVWSGKPGNSLWFSDDPRITAITGGEGIKFENGRPGFTPWSQGNLDFELGVLKGTNNDFSEVAKRIMKEYNLPSQQKALELLKEFGWAPHHSSITQIQLVPFDLNKLIPHIGPASDLRGGF